MRKSDLKRENIKRATQKSTFELTEKIADSKDILEAIGDGISIQDRNFKIIYENRVHRKEYGDHIGEYCYKAYPKSETVCEDCPVALTFKDGKVHSVLKEIFTGEEYKYVEITASPLKNERGKILAAIEVVRDVTRRVTAEREFMKSQERFSTLVENTPMGVWQDDAEGRTVYVNAAMCNMLEVDSPEDLYMKNWKSFFNKENLDTIQREYKKRLKGIASSYEVILLGKKGKRRDVLIYGAPLLSFDGTFQGTIATFLDITKRKKSEKALRESEATLRTVIESLPFDFFLIDEGGRYALQNTKCKQTYGDIIGKRPEDLHVKKETWELWRVNNQRAFSGEVIEEDVYFELEGKGRYYHNIISPIREANKIRGILGINIDISERKEAEEALKQSEEKFRSLAEESPNMIFINNKGRVVYANQKCEKMMGYSKAEFYSESFDFRSLIASEHQNLVMSAFQKHMEGEEVDPYEYELVTKNGEQLEVIITTKLINYENDKAILGIVTDITERKKAEKALMHIDKELREKTQSLEELNTALKVLLEKREEDRIQGEEKVLMNLQELVAPYLEKLKNEGLNRNQKTYVDIIESNLDEIISPFTLRLSSSHLHLTPTEIQVANLIKQGKRSKEIAELIYSSPKAVAFHRGNIRKKLGLQNKKTNLRSYLLSCFQNSD